MYKKASKLKLRFATQKGNLTVEQLWDLSMEDLKVEVKNQYEVIKEASIDDDPDLSFLGDGKVDSKETLKFEILKDIFTTKKQEIENSAVEAEKRMKNKRIMEIIAKKQDEDLQGKSIEELKAMLEG